MKWNKVLSISCATLGLIGFAANGVIQKNQRRESNVRIGRQHRAE
jgi:hypothetical protein